jgi:hypothetical protein
MNVVWQSGIAVLMLASACAMAQDGADDATIFRSTSTLVMVPALVRNRAGECVTNLNSNDFTLYDNGLLQPVTVANIDRAPMALVVVVQTGGTAFRHFLDYADLPVFLDWLAGGSSHELMLVSFDSRVEMIWHFPVRADG